MRISVDDLRSLYAALARSHGADAEEERLFADGLLRADLRGHHTQGIGLFSYLSELLTTGSMHFGREPEVIRDAPAVALIDAGSEAGHVAAARAMDLAIAKAQKTGIGFVTVRASGDCGMAANYALQALDAGMIGIAMSTGPILVAPWGGREAQFCTNPLAIAVPAGEEVPVVIDMATSANSMGGVVLAARDGRRLDGPEVVDREGHYTDDPLRVILDVMDRESRMEGALLPAGPKGFGMVLMVEMLSALLSGARRWEGAGIGDEARGREAFYSQTLIAISVPHFQEPAEFAASADRMIRTLKGLAPAQGFPRVRLHGDQAREIEADYRKNGVSIRPEEWQMALAAAKARGLDLSAFPEVTL